MDSYSLFFKHRSIHLDLFILPTSEALKKFVVDRNFVVVAFGHPSAEIVRMFICSSIERNSSSGSGSGSGRDNKKTKCCLFLGEIVLNKSSRKLSGTWKCEKRKYLAIFLDDLSLHQLDES